VATETDGTRVQVLSVDWRARTLAKKISEEKTWLKIMRDAVVYLKKDSLD